MKEETQHTPNGWHKRAKCQSCGSTTIAFEINPDKVRAVNSHEALLATIKEMMFCDPSQLQIIGEKAIAQAEGK